MTITTNLPETVRALAQLEQQITEDKHAMQTRRNRFRLFLGGMLIFLICMALINFHYLHVLTKEFRAMLVDMVTMYQHFDQVAQHMNTMTGYMTDMEQNIRMMPVIDKQMTAMNTDISNMQQNMSGMLVDVSAMADNVSKIDSDVQGMSGLFHDVNQNVGYMQFNVREMSGVIP